DRRQIQLFDAATGQFLPDESVPSGAICALSRDWTLAASSLGYSKITIWDLNTLGRMTEVPLSSSRGWFVGQPPCFFSPDGEKFILADDRTVKIFDVGTGE